MNKSLKIGNKLGKCKNIFIAEIGQAHEGKIKKHLNILMQLVKLVLML